MFTEDYRNLKEEKLSILRFILEFPERKSDVLGYLSSFLWDSMYVFCWKTRSAKEEEAIKNLVVNDKEYSELIDEFFRREGRYMEILKQMHDGAKWSHPVGPNIKHINEFEIK